MSKYARLFEVSFAIAADLSASQYRGVVASGNEGVIARATVTFASGSVIGILQNAPNTTTQEARVLLLGTSKLEINDSIAVGSFRFNTVGQGIPNGAGTTAGSVYIGGIALEAYTGASCTGGLIEVFFRPDSSTDSVTTA